MKRKAVFIISILANLPLFSHASDEKLIQKSEEVNKELLMLALPSKTQEGAFVIKLRAGSTVRDAVPDTSKVELWRSFNGGDFELVSTHAQFNAISQSVYKNGRYTYQARMISYKNGEKVSEGVSANQHIDVDLRVPSHAYSLQEFAKF